MTTMNIENFDQETLRKIYMNLPSQQDWDEECQVCKLPQMLHVDANGKKRDGSCKYNKETEAVQRKKMGSVQGKNEYRTKMAYR